LSTQAAIEQDFARGLYVDNLASLTRQCMQLARSGEKALAYYTLASIFSDIYVNWDERGLFTTEVREMEDRIVPPVRRVLESIKSGAEPMDLHEQLEALVRAFLQARSRTDTGDQT
jgi:hypothetical protein